MFMALSHSNSPHCSLVYEFAHRTHSAPVFWSRPCFCLAPPDTLEMLVDFWADDIVLGFRKYVGFETRWYPVLHL
jgi:hypothetical protein